MSKIRMNTEFRNKILNRYVESAETETTQEQQAYFGARETVDSVYPKAFDLARLVVERSYPSEDVQTCRTLKQKYGDPLDVVAKDKCFYFSYAKENPDEDEDKNVSEHFDLVYMVKLTMEITIATKVESNLLMLIIVMS